MYNQSEQIHAPSPKRMFLAMALVMGGVVAVGLSWFAGMLG